MLAKGVTVMNRNIVKKALILTLTAFLFVFGGVLGVIGETRLYELNNRILNGDFSSGTDSFQGNRFSVVNGRGRLLTDTAGLDAFVQQGNRLVIGRKYYIRFDIEIITGWLKVQNIFSNDTVIKDSGIKSLIWTATTTGFLFDNENSIITDMYFDNIMYIDLTSIFGAGREPSISDFELLYLPDLEWFSYYNSFIPETYTTLYQMDYPDLVDDLTGIDYTKSIVNRNGTNITLDVEMYFYDVTYQGTSVPGTWFAEYYILNNFPQIKIFDKIYQLNWVMSNYSDRVIILDLDTTERNALKQVLFNRNIDRFEEYFAFSVEAFDFDIFQAPASLYFVLSSTFDLLVDAKSFLLSREVVTDNDFNILNTMFIKTYDRNGNLYLPALMFQMGDIFMTSYVDNFGSGYTNISRFNFEFKLGSPNPDAPYNSETHRFYEIGMFSSNQVIQINPVESDIGVLFPQQICDWYQFGCHTSNIFNDLASTIYNGLQIESLIDSVTSVIDSVALFLSLAPVAANSIIISFSTALGVGIVFIIYTNASKED
jgi:hypothetical protein